MSRSVKTTSGWQRALIDAALRPRVFVSSMKYRLESWRAKPEKPLPESLLSGIGAGNLDDGTNFRDLSFTFAAIALSAKVACADGKLTQEKYIAFRESFPLQGGVCGKIRSLFMLACRNETPFEHYVTQIKHMFPHNSTLFMALLERLFRIAAANGELPREAEKLLYIIAHMLEIPAADYSDMCLRYGYSSLAANHQKARHVMGVDAGVKQPALKKRYRELMQHYHPDRFAGYDLSPEVQLLLQLKSSEINAAYRALSRQPA